MSILYSLRVGTEQMDGLKGLFRKLERDDPAKQLAVDALSASAPQTPRSGRSGRSSRRVQMMRPPPPEVTFSALRHHVQSFAASRAAAAARGSAQARPPLASPPARPYSAMPATRAGGERGFDAGGVAAGAHRAAPVRPASARVA